jgi:hypothetical protein
MSSDYKYNGQEYDNSFGCSFPTINASVEYNSSDDYDIVFIKDVEDEKNVSSRDIGIRLMSFCEKTAKWFIKKNS